MTANDQRVLLQKEAKELKFQAWREEIIGRWLKWQGRISGNRVKEEDGVRRLELGKAEREVAREVEEMVYA